MLSKSAPRMAQAESKSDIGNGKPSDGALVGRQLAVFQPPHRPKFPRCEPVPPRHSEYTAECHAVMALCNLHEFGGALLPADGVTETHVSLGLQPRSTALGAGTGSFAPVGAHSSALIAQCHRGPLLAVLQRRKVLTVQLTCHLSSQPLAESRVCPGGGRRSDARFSGTTISAGRPPRHFAGIRPP